MKIKTVILVIPLFLTAGRLLSQDKAQMFLYLETGMDFISCSPPEKDYVREGFSQDPYYYEPVYIRALMYKNYAGIKAEVRILNNKLGLVGGLRYTRMVSSIGKNEYWTSRTDYFYLLFKTQGSSTEYLRVKDINQVSDYIGIPLELKIYPYESRVFQIYYKIGGDINFRLKTSTNISFSDNAMEQFEKEASQVIEDPWSIYATVHAAIGLKIGKENKPGINLEACIPAGIIADLKSSFVDPQAGGGLQFNIRFPL